MLKLVKNESGCLNSLGIILYLPTIMASTSGWPGIIIVWSMILWVPTSLYLLLKKKNNNG